MPLPYVIYLHPDSPRWFTDDAPGRVAFLALDGEPDPGVAAILYWRARGADAEARAAVSPQTTRARAGSRAAEETADDRPLTGDRP